MRKLFHVTAADPPCKDTFLCDFVNYPFVIGSNFPNDLGQFRVCLSAHENLKVVFGPLNLTKVSEAAFEFLKTFLDLLFLGLNSLQFCIQPDPIGL
jgi:hypothetical protein